jgi:hypothetical protein
MSENISLEFVFSNVNRWLDHAEKKNAFLFSAFSLISLLTVILNNQSSISLFLKIGSVITIGVYIVSLFFILLSLFPITKISKILLEKGKDKKLRPEDNLLFYGDIAKYNSEEYLHAINTKYALKVDSNAIHKDLVCQIIINSNITSNKYQCFKISSMMLFIGIIQFAVFFSISLFN